MQSGTCCKNLFCKGVGSEPAFVFDYFHKLDTHDRVSTLTRMWETSLLNSCSSREISLPLLFLTGCTTRLKKRTRYPASWYKVQDTEKEYLVSAIFLSCVLPWNSLTDKQDQAKYYYDCSVLYRMTFLFPTVLLLLFFVTSRTRNLSFGTVMEQYKLISEFGKLKQAFGKLFICLYKHKSHCLRAQTENIRQIPPL